MQDYQEYNADDVLVEAGNYEFCDICGHKLEDGDEIFITETGQVACGLVELLEQMCGHKIDS